MKYDFRTIESCRLCGGVLYEESVAFKDSPLANELYATKGTALAAEVFPLEVVMCKECKHIQLKHIVDAERLFSEYVYASGTSKTFRDHFAELALLIQKLKPSGKVLEVGSNDGTLLKALMSLKISSIGIEPSKQLTEKCQQDDLEVHTGFFNPTLVNKLLSDHGEFAAVVGNNVFAHIDDLDEAFALASKALRINGIFVFEVAHSLNLVNDLLFDTIYHEHMSYHSVISLQKLLPKHNFKISEIQKIEMHGGSIRVICRKTINEIPVSPSLVKILDEEKKANLDSQKWMRGFSLRLENLQKAISEDLNKLGESVIWIGYGAPAKAVTFINEFGFERISFLGIIDDNLAKQNKFLPKSGFEIISREKMLSLIGSHKTINQLNCVIFPWNLTDEIQSKLNEFSKFNLNLIWCFPEYKRLEINS